MVHPASPDVHGLTEGGCEGGTLTFYRKDEGQGAITEKPTSCIFSKRQRDRERTGHRVKAAGENRGPLRNPFLGFNIPQSRNSQGFLFWPNRRLRFVDKELIPSFPEHITYQAEGGDNSSVNGQRQSVFLLCSQCCCLFSLFSQVSPSCALRKLLTSPPLL